MQRKVIQICETMARSEELDCNFRELTSLCDDGTIWRFNDNLNQWELIKNIPQDDLIEIKNRMDVLYKKKRYEGLQEWEKEELLDLIKRFKPLLI